MAKKNKQQNKQPKPVQKLPDWVTEDNIDQYYDMVIRNKDVAARERERAIEQKHRLDIYKKEQAAYDRAQAQEETYKKTRQAQIAQREFNRGIGNYQARNYIRHIQTASQVIRKPFTPNGIRSEFRSKGYTGPSGFPELWNNWDNTTGSTSRGVVKGNLSIGSTRSSRKITQNGLTPSVVPDLSYLLGGSVVNAGVGKNDVIMPVGMIKIKKRGGRFNYYGAS